MKLSMMVLMISLTANRARSHPHSAPATAPAAVPAPSTTAIAGGRGHCARCTPQAAAASAPNSNCPSAPIFHNAPENAALTARPVKTNGVAFTRVSVAASQLPNAPLSSAAKVAAGLAPNTASASATIPSAIASAPSGLPSAATIFPRDPELVAVGIELRLPGPHPHTAGRPDKRWREQRCSRLDGGQARPPHLFLAHVPQAESVFGTVPTTCSGDKWRAGGAVIPLPQPSAGQRARRCDREARLRAGGRG